MVAGRWTAKALVAAILCLAGPGAAQNTYTYIGQIASTSALIAWGTTDGGGGQNTIGRDSKPMGKAEIHVGNLNLTSDRNWIEVKDLRPDTQYPYTVQVNGHEIGGGVFRTYPARATKLTFFVIGDFGVGGSKQKGIADAMWTEFQRRAQSDSPVRFVITVGDNIYADANFAYVSVRSGDEDKDWDPKFFTPYRELIRQIPFYPTLGNHDGNGSEKAGDLAAYLDNFFFPENRPARWYQFSFGGLADFFALDSTENTPTGHAVPQYGPESEQTKWLSQALPASRAEWKIPYFHHPIFNAGPGHGASYKVLRHWVDLFQRSGVKVVFAGHEHNFQISEDNDATGHIRYVISGSGGELRGGNVAGNMVRAHIQGWAPVRQFLVVEIDGKTMRITPISDSSFTVRGANGNTLPVPFVIQKP